MVIRGYRVGPLLKKTAQEIGTDKVSSLAAQTVAGWTRPLPDTRFVTHITMDATSHPTRENATIPIRR